MKTHDHTQRGFVLLFTVLITSIVLLMTIGISNVAFKEAQLSGLARDAHYAFFAADTGAECALYLDIKQSAFTEQNGGGSFSCDGFPFSLSSSSISDPLFTTRYSFELELSDGTARNRCASVTVDKTPLLPSARIESLGYNTPCDTPGVSTVERAIRVRY